MLTSLKKLFDLISSPGGRIQYLFGSQGAGKTDFAILQAEFLYSLKQVEIGTNIKTLADNYEHIEYIEEFEELEDWLRSDGRKFYILDEASSLLTGYYSDSGDVIDAFKSLITKLRKNDSNLVLIGHSGKDIHPLFRRLAIFVHKRSKKEVRFYRTARADSSGKIEAEDQLLKLSNIPPSNWDYSTDEESTFYIDIEDEEEKYTEEELEELVEERLEIELREHRNSQISKIYELTELSYSDLAEIYGLSKQRVSTIINS
jgi:hypothetical protein